MTDARNFTTQHLNNRLHAGSNDNYITQIIYASHIQIIHTTTNYIYTAQQKPEDRFTRAPLAAISLHRSSPTQGCRSNSEPT